ncbi:transmembrane protein, putative (macronuclear) [Tetrahymena thermophila SB210]|uniref:Transmembrane protein, putative n=1 Tax=Tetrahymena thermophila (strain SB210) TaxID=312017 RepID=Q22LR1_TETTS|nr:transmembrane protein, putative [Tetrahymena thermophila SB210]EAR86205.1 transmembrane protein, putative [Tetrahymena thermophila SB210]|eukprot:XP_976800.1 transmembrane protein, putative [Tetrahymena thermophila SB210]
MKATLILISLISLVSIFTLVSFETHKDLKQDDSKQDGCLVTYVDFSTIDVLAMNECSQSYKFKFTLTFPSQTLDLETDCIYEGKNQIFSLDEVKNFRLINMKVTEKQEC